MSDPIFAAIIGFFAAVGGGVFQAWSARRFEEVKFKRQLRSEAYLAYFKGISALSFARDDQESRLVALTNMAEARARIAVSGSKSVIEKMNIVFANGDNYHSAKARADLGNMLNAMRDDSLGSSDMPSPDALFVLTYGETPRKD